MYIKKKLGIFIILVSIMILIVGCGNDSKKATEANIKLTVEEYTQRIKDAVKGTNDTNIILKDENIVINSEEKSDTKPLATYMFTNSTGILYKENEMDLVISDADVALLGDSTYNLARIFIGTVDSELSAGDRQKVLQDLGFDTEPLNINENKFIKSTNTDNYKFVYMYNGETKAKVIQAEHK